MDEVQRLNRILVEITRLKSDLATAHANWDAVRALVQRLVAESWPMDAGRFVKEETLLELCELLGA